MRFKDECPTHSQGCICTLEERSYALIALIQVDPFRDRKPGARQMALKVDRRQKYVPNDNIVLLRILWNYGLYPVRGAKRYIVRKSFSGGGLGWRDGKWTEYMLKGRRKVVRLRVRRRGPLRCPDTDSFFPSCSDKAFIDVNSDNTTGAPCLR